MSGNPSHRRWGISETQAASSCLVYIPKEAAAVGRRLYGTTSCRRWFTTMNSTDEEGYLGLSYDFDVVVVCTLLWVRSRR
jgi:hypothetical protein